MGYFAHDAALVHTWNEKAIKKVAEFRESLPSEFQQLIIGPIPSAVNFHWSYVFLPDGSKEGWGVSKDGDKYRAEFVSLFTDYEDVVSVRFGGDYGHEVGVTVKVHDTDPES